VDVYFGLKSVGMYQRGVFLRASVYIRVLLFFSCAREPIVFVHEFWMSCFSYVGLGLM